MADQQLGKTQIVSPTQVGVLLYQKGFRGVALAKMIATSIGCENPAGNAGIVNNTPTTGDYSVGLFQINYFQGLAAQRTKDYGSPVQLANSPAAQAAAAWKLSDGGTNFQPWIGDWGDGPCHASAAMPKATAIAAAVTAMSDAKRAATVKSFTSDALPNSTTGTGVTAASSTSSDCLIKSPSVLGIGGGCIISKGEVRAVGGGLLIVAGGILMLAAGILIAGHKMPAQMQMIQKAIPHGGSPTT
jgi:hypothetical protein